MIRSVPGKVRLFAPWFVGAVAGFVDGAFLPEPVPRAIWFSMTLYAIGGACAFGLLSAALGFVLESGRARRLALGIEGAGFAFLFGVYEVTTATGGVLATPGGQRAGLLLVLPLSAGIGLALARAWPSRRAPSALRVGLFVALMVWPTCMAIESLRPPASGGRGLVLVSMDAARGDRISAHGYWRPTTPNVDQLVESGLSFTRAMVQCPASGPSHATMLTGLPPLAHQVLGNADVLDPAVITVAERLVAAGYSTAGFANNYYIDGRYGFAQGFQTWVNEYRAPAVATWRAQHLLRTTVAYQVFHRLTRRPGQKNRDAVEGALQWLRHRPPGDFFLFLHLMDPHAPYDAPDEMLSRLSITRGRVRDTPELRARLESATAEEIDALRDLYDASVALADARVGELVDELQRQGLLERSLVVITADHGEILDENGPVFDHGLPGQGNLHVPLVLGGGLSPGEEGTRVDTTVATTAWVPTAFAILGVPYVEQGSQDPVPPLPLGPGGGRPVYGLTGVAEGDRSYALDGSLKLVLGRQGLDGCFDLGSDPLERDDLCSASLDSAARRRFLELEAGLLEWLDATASAGIVSGRRSEQDFDPAIREQLRALGYID